MSRCRTLGSSEKMRSWLAAARGPPDRGQTGLPALAIALLLLTIVTGLGLAIADGALASAERDADERQVATSLAERLVADDSRLTVRPNVVNGTKLDRLDGSELERTYPVVDGYDVTVRANESTVATTGDVSGGTTFRRLAVVQRDHTRTMEPDIGRDRSVSLPRRTDRATIELTPSGSASVTSVRVNDRVVLRNPAGLSGRFEVDLSRFETAEFTFGGTGRLDRGSVRIDYRAPRTTKTMLVVTVDG